MIAHSLVRRSAAVLRLPPHARAAVQARRTVSALAAAHDEELADRGRLLVTEVVANAVEHTGSDAVTVELAVDDATGGMFCAVFDTAPGLPLVEADAGALDEGGRGLALLRALSDEWGCTREPGGKWVWFHLRPARV